MSVNSILSNCFLNLWPSFSSLASYSFLFQIILPTGCWKLFITLVLYIVTYYQSIFSLQCTTPERQLYHLNDLRIHNTNNSFPKYHGIWMVLNFLLFQYYSKLSRLSFQFSLHACNMNSRGTRTKELGGLANL